MFQEEFENSNKGDGAFVSNLKQEGHTYSSKKETVHLTDSTTPTLDHKKTTFYISRILGIVVVLLLAYLANVLNTDYGFWGVIVIFAFYLFKDKKAVMLTSFVILCIIRYGLDIINYGFNYAYVLLCIFTAIAAIFIGLYNGKQGKKIKYLLYFFYPVHLLLLYFIFQNFDKGDTLFCQSFLTKGTLLSVNVSLHFRSVPNCKTKLGVSLLLQI